MEDPLLKASVRPSRLWTAASYIITTEFCERLCYYGFAGSLVYFFQQELNYSNADAINMFQLWSGSVYVTPLLGGLIADVYLGRYVTLLVFSAIYLLGLILFIFGSVPDAINPALVFLAMYTIALAAGGIKPNASTMGADQFDPAYEQDRNEAASFFNFFYVAINCGALLSYTVLSYVAQNGVSSLGGKKYGFLCAVSLQTIILTCGILVFVSGSKVYVKRKLQSKSMLAQVSCVACEALSFLWSRQKPRQPLRSSINSNKTAPTHWLDRAKMAHGGSYSHKTVESLKLMTRLSPFLVTFVCFWGVYSQTKTSFQIQSCQSSLTLGDFEIPVTSLNIFNNITILVLVPVFDRYMYPALRRRGIELSMQMKILIGFSLAALAMLVSAIVEIGRISNLPLAGDYMDEAARANISPCRNIDNFDPYLYLDWANSGASFKPSNCKQISTGGCATVQPLPLSCVSCDNIPQMSRQSVLAQIPQFVLIGVAEIFASITSLEFFYSQAPQQMRSVSQALNLLTSALGSWITIPLTLVVNAGSQPWITTDVNEGHLTWYFFLLAAMQLVVTIWYAWLTKNFQPVDPLWLLELAEEEDTRRGPEETEQEWQRAAGGAGDRDKLLS